MKKSLLLIALFLGTLMTSAQELDNYKYIIIPETFEFTGEVDEYRLNSLTKFLFEQNGYNTLMNTENRPLDLQNDRCLGLRTKLENNSGLFVTKLTFKLIDCNEKVVFTSKEGRSREKDFQSAYQEALKDAFTSFEEMDYNYKARDIKIAKTEKEPKPVKVEKAEKEEKITKAETEESEISKEEELVDSDKKSEDQENEVLVVGIVENTELDDEKTSDDIEVYEFAGKSYHLKPIEQGLGLFQENSAEPIAVLIATNSGESYIYNSLTSQGVAYFDKSGDLIVEYFSRAENKKISQTYKLTD